jgi:Tol biopolymer transport system component/DNA-binding winged helix-turn-helix (wHTH) protein
MDSEARTRFYRFDDFVVDAARCLLLRGGQPVPLNPKAFDLLLALIENRGQPLTKDELLERVWPNQSVEEGNLPVHVSAVRKALGERRGENRYVVTLPGRGYRFVAEVVEVTGIDVAEPASQPRAARNPPVGRRAVAVAVLFAVLASAVAYQMRHRTRAAADRDPASGAARATRQLTAAGNVSSATLSRDGRQFAYVLFDKGKESLWLAPVDGGAAVQLRPDEDVDYENLTFAPAGDRMFYTLRGTLYAMPTAGGEAHRLREHVDGGFSLSPDGTRVAFIRRDNRRHASAIVIAPLTGSDDERELAALPAGQEFSPYGPAWSPDGTMLAIGASAQTASGKSVMTAVQIADGAMRPLSAQAFSSIGRIAWLRDGGGIVFNAIGVNSDYHIWFLGTPDGGLRKITNDLSRYGRASVSVSDDGQQLLSVRSEGNSSVWAAPSDELSRSHQITSRSLGKLDGSAGLAWTPDGRIVYASFFNNSYSLWTTGVDGRDARQITSSGFMDTFPEMTSDGRYIVFASDRGGGTDIWRVNADGGDLRRLTTGGRSGQPDTTPDGRWVLYAASDDGDPAIWRVSIDGGQPIRVLARANWPRISPDGTMIACAYADKAGAPIADLALFSMQDARLIARFDPARGATLNNGVQWTADGTALVYRDFGEGLWRQAVTGGPPQKLPGVTAKRIYFFDWSRDGRLFAMSYGDESRDAVLISHFR